VKCHTYSSAGINDNLSFGLDPDLKLTELTAGRSGSATNSIGSATLAKAQVQMMQNWAEHLQVPN
jgi:hypothetical protein